MHIKAILVVLFALALNVGTAFRTEPIGSLLESDICNSSAVICDGADDLLGRGYPVEYFEESFAPTGDQEVNGSEIYQAAGDINPLNFLLNWLVWIGIVGVAVMLVIGIVEFVGAVGIVVLILAYIYGYLNIVNVF